MQLDVKPDKNVVVRRRTAIDKALAHAPFKSHCPKFVRPCNFDYGDVSYVYVSVYMRRECRHMTSEFLWNKSFYFIVVS